MNTAIHLIEHGYMPDFITRQGIRYLLRQRLAESYCNGNVDAFVQQIQSVVEVLKQSPIAVETVKANEQHYELPAEFYDLVLGKHKKYSCCLFTNTQESLDQAEADMLEKTCLRAGLTDGQAILELGTFYIYLLTLRLWMGQSFIVYGS
jgi:cyclopropane-fatty-acyl-phospholipid synthase